MEPLLKLINFVAENGKDLSEIVAYTVLIASILIKMLPVLDKNNKILPIIKFIGKYFALNRTVTDEDRIK